MFIIKSLRYYPNAGRLGDYEDFLVDTHSPPLYLKFQKSGNDHTFYPSYGLSNDFKRHPYYVLNRGYGPRMARKGRSWLRICRKGAGGVKTQLRIQFETVEERDGWIAFYKANFLNRREGDDG